jgi:hypothetical protein
MELPVKKPTGYWVQTDRAAHEAWAILTGKSPLAAKIMHLLAGRVGEHNAVVVSQGTLAELAGASRRGVQNALEVLRRERWIEVRQIGDRATVNAYVINSRVAWTGSRDGLRYALFSAAVLVSETEQPDKEDLGAQTPLKPFPYLFKDEQQLPTGPGLPPVSSPSLPGMEHPLPAIELERETREEAASFDELIDRLMPAFTETQED